ncbi:transcription factor HES-2-like [Actinia tenebrosa]|uniref:Transcription cofactor HES-6 n=1 Tax=Actinia tenebrosa TaxID=6105 RepID=A0A6P8I4F0_ACTTE|nr:transcription factor HES-2-like [Actinia tenebrosa]
MSDTVIKSKRAKQANKSSKPLLERQRRARINNSLNELKNLVLSSLYNGCPQAEKNSEKMEKAEILELTVNFLKLARSRRINGFRPAESKETMPSKYQSTNYNECFARVSPLEGTQRCREHFAAPHLPPLTPCSMPGTTSTINEGLCFRGVRPCVGYEVASTIPRLSTSPLSKVMVNSPHQQQVIASNSLPFSLHVPSNKVQVWRPW